MSLNEMRRRSYKLKMAHKIKANLAFLKPVLQIHHSQFLVLVCLAGGPGNKNRLYVGQTWCCREQPSKHDPIGWEDITSPSVEWDLRFGCGCGCLVGGVLQFSKDGKRLCPAFFEEISWEINTISTMTGCSVSQDGLTWATIIVSFATISCIETY